MSGNRPLRRRQRIRVVAAGTFDGIHDGHRYYLRTARSLGDHLTVIVARSATVSLIKGKRVQRSERQRRSDLASLPEVDRAVLGNHVRPGHTESRFWILTNLKPDIICLGYDQPVDEGVLRSFLDTHRMKRTRIVRVRKAPRSS